MICDFCSAPNPTWDYPAKDFSAYVCGMVHGSSIGHWAACNTCHELIEAGDRASLAARSICTLPLPGTEEVWDFLVDLHAKFFAHRCGPAVPVAAEHRN